MENQAKQDRKVVLFIYDLILILSGLYVLEKLWDSGFYLDTVLLYSPLWLLFAIFLYLPKRARTRVVP